MTRSLCDSIKASHNIDTSNLPNAEGPSTNSTSQGLFAGISMNMLLFVFISLAIGAVVMLVTGLAYCCCRGQVNQAPTTGLQQVSNTLASINQTSKGILPQVVRQPQRLVLSKNPSHISNIRILQ